MVAGPHGEVRGEGPASLGPLHAHGCTSVDAYRAGGGAETITGARIDAPSRPIGDGCSSCRGSHELDALARTAGEIAARAHWFAEAAFDARIHQRINRRQRLEMPQMRLRIIIQQHARIEQPVWIQEMFHCVHDGDSIRAPLGGDEGRHVAPGAVFGFQMAAMRDHQVGQGSHESGIARDLCCMAEIRRQRKMQIAVLGVTKQHRIGVAMRGEQGTQSAHPHRQFRHRKGHVFDDHGGARCTHCSHRGKQPFANRPIARLQDRIAGKA